MKEKISKRLIQIQDRIDFLENILSELLEISPECKLTKVYIAGGVEKTTLIKEKQFIESLVG